MELQLTGRVNTGAEFLDVDLRDLQVVQGEGGTFLYAATGQNGGISTWRLDEAGGVVTLTDTTWFTGTGIGIGTGALSTLMLEGRERLVLENSGDGKLVYYDLEDDGGIGKLTRLDLPGTPPLANRHLPPRCCRMAALFSICPTPPAARSAPS